MQNCLPRQLVLREQLVLDILVGRLTENQQKTMLTHTAQDKPEEMVVARMGCPLLVALGDQETFIASDVSAVIAFTRRIAYLEDGDIAVLSANGIDKLIDKTGAETQRKVKVSELSLASLELGPYSHFMQKEIHEQPRAIADTAEVFLDGGFEPENFGANAREVFDDGL